MPTVKIPVDVSSSMVILGEFKITLHCASLCRGADLSCKVLHHLEFDYYDYDDVIHLMVYLPSSPGPG